MHAGITTMLPRVAESELPPGVIKSFFSPTLARSATRAIDPLQTVSYLHPGRSVGPDFPFVILPSGRWRLLPYQQSGHSRSMVANGDSSKPTAIEESIPSVRRKFDASQSELNVICTQFQR